VLTVAYRSLLAGKRHFAMTAAAVVIGVSFMAGTFILTDSISASFKNAFVQPALGRGTTVRFRSAFNSTGVVAVDVQRAPVPDDLIDTIRGVPGVKAVTGVVQGYAQLVGQDGKAIQAEKAPMIGTNWIPEPDLSFSKLATGHRPTDGDQVAIDGRTFTDHGFRLGDRVTVLSTHAPRRFTIVGTMTFGGSGSPGGATVVAFDGATAQEMVGQPGQWDEIEAAGFRPGVSAGVLTQRISDVLPSQYEAVTSESALAAVARATQNALGRLPAIMLIFAGVALFAGVFIVYNTFSILLTQRSRETALLLAIGARRGQVVLLVVAEAAVLGVVASALGLVVGAVVALGMERVFVATGFGLPSLGLHLGTRTVVISALSGTAVTIVSAIIPARRASRTSPVAALTESDLGEPPPRPNPSLTGAGAGLAGLVLLMAGLLSQPRKPTFVGIGAAVAFVGLATLSPSLIIPLAKVVGAPARAWGGVTGRLSQENAMRNPRRTAATAAALMIGVSLVTIMAIMGASVKGTAAKTMQDSLRADYIVSTSGGGFLSGATLNGFSSELAQSLRERPEVASVGELRAGFWHRGASLEYLSAIDTSVARAVNLRLSAGDIATLDRGEVLVDASVARRQKLRVGDRMEMGFDSTGTQSLIVGGTFRANEFVESYVISIGTYVANYPKSTLDQQLFVFDRASPMSSLSAIKRVTDPYRNLDVQSPAALKTTEQRRLDTVINLGYVLMAFSILIALIGIINTLALSIVERRRELGLLRVIGMHRSQVRAMVRAESVQVCLIGALIGLVVGTAIGLALVAATSFGTTKVVRVPLLTLAVVVLLAGLAGVLASIIPARRAARLDVLDALAVS
jgi:putative ABC transport system permease protein